MSKTKEKDAKTGVSEFPAGNNTPALLKPPTSLLAPMELSEAEKAFIETATETAPTGPTKLPFITINHKAQTFRLPSGEEVDGNDGVSGFIIAHFTNRSYYEKAFDPKGEKVPPDCKSADCVTPDADSPHKQAADCLSCKHNIFGSAPVGKGKACKERIWLFLVNPEFGVPPISVLILPPSAIGLFYGGMMKRGYFDQMKAKHRAWQIVWTKITLERESDDQIHCTPGFEMGDVANLDVAKALAAINNQFVSLIKRARHETAPKDDE